MKSNKYVLHFANATLAFVGLSGCASVPRYESNPRVKWADDAGSVTVAHIASTRWEDAAPQLQPKFQITSDVALASALPVTQSLDERIADILSASFRVALPTAVKSVTSTENETNGVATTTVESSLNEQSGGISGVAAPSLAAPNAAALAALTPATLGQDPMLRYLAATALFQEVTLLNRYVADAVRYRGSQAFLVRLCPPSAFNRQAGFVK